MDNIIEQLIDAINNRHKNYGPNGRPFYRDILANYKRDYSTITENDSRICDIDIDKIEHVFIENTDENIKLAGLIIKTEPKSDKWVVALHGYSSSKESALFTVNYYASLGYNILAYDARNHGESSDALTTLGIEEVNDVKFILDYLVKEQNAKSFGLIGFSMGAFTVNHFNLLPISNNYDIDWVISDSTFYKPKDTFERIAGFFLGEGLSNKAIMTLLFALYKKKKNFDIDAFDTDNLLKDVVKTAPTLFICSDSDVVTLCEDSYKFKDNRSQLSGSDKDDLINLKTTEHVRGAITKTDEYFKAVDNFLDKLKD